MINIYIYPRSNMIHCKSCRREKKPVDFKANKREYKTCNSCRVKKSKKKHTIEECQELAKTRGGVCLSETYKNNRTKIKWRCSENHEWEAEFDRVKNRSQWCYICSGSAKLTIEECQELAKTRGGECLSETYKNNSTKMKWKCSENHEWCVSVKPIKNSKSWCPKCAIKKCSDKRRCDIEECQELAKIRGGECLSTVYIKSVLKLKWRCSEKHEWEANLNSVKNMKSWCPYCARKKKFNN